jgi:Fe-S-cluster containining protein
MNMLSGELRQFYSDNPMLYGTASGEDLDQLSRIFELYPDSVRLLSDREAVKLSSFECRRCGRCCASVKFITVSHEDVKRWVKEHRDDILDRLVIDRRRTPLLTRIGKRDIEAAKRRAASLVEELDPEGEKERVSEILYLTALLECTAYVNRKNSACTFLREDNGSAACAIYDTKPRVCQKFPYYMGKYTDSRLLKEDSFCPELSSIAKAYRKKN